MGYGDLILFPVFLIILSLFFRAIRNTYDDPLLRKYHRQGFWIKILGCIAFFTYSVYLSPGRFYRVVSKRRKQYLSSHFTRFQPFELAFSKRKIFLMNLFKRESERAILSVGSQFHGYKAGCHILIPNFWPVFRNQPDLRQYSLFRCVETFSFFL